MKTGTISHRKFKRLKRLLSAPVYRVVGVLESLWMMGADQARMGDVGRLSDDEIADALEWEGEAATLIEHLCSSEWLDRSEAHRLVIHDWIDHCPRFVLKWIARQFGVDDEKRAKSMWASKYGNGRPLDDQSGEVGKKVAQNEPLRACARTQPNPTQPNQSPPTPRQASDPFDTDSEWGGVAARLRGVGIVKADGAAQGARAAGRPVALVHRIIDFWNDNKPRLTPNALVVRLESPMTPGETCEGPWIETAGAPPLRLSRDQNAQIETRAERENARRRLEADEAVANRVAENERLEKLEADHGATLDGMKLEQVRSLIRREFPSIADMMLRRVTGKASLKQRQLRIDLLEKLADRAAAAVELFQEAPNG